MGRGTANGRGGYRGGKFRGGSQTTARGRGGGRGGYPNPSAALLEEGLDLNIQMYANAATNDRPSTPGRGRGRGNFTPRGKGTPRGGTPGGSGSSTPNRGRGRGRGFGPRGGRHVEGIGSSPQSRGGISRPNTTLSNLLYQERPLLKPIIFVPSVHSKVLFQDNDDELLKAIVEDVDDTERSHVPTAERVSRVFSGSVPHFGAEDEEGAAEDLEEIEEVDFNDIGKLFEPNATSNSKTRINKAQKFIAEEQFTGAYLRTSSSALPMNVAVEALAKQVEEQLSTAGDDAPEVSIVESTANIGSLAETITTEQLFFVDTKPTTVQSDLRPGVNVELPTALQDDEDDIIVYVAPHPRHSSTAASPDERDALRPMSTTEDKAMPQNQAPDTSMFTPYVPPLFITSAIPDVTPASTSKPPTASVSFSFASSKAGVNESGSSTPARLLAPPVTTPRLSKMWKYKLNRASAKKNKGKAKGKGKKGRGTFGSFGAMREEALLAAALDAGRDSRFHERRRGDSDLEWGDSDNEVQPDDMQRVLEMLQSRTSKSKGKAKALENDHGMEIDSDLDLSAMQSFIGGMLGHDAGQHITLDDFEDEKLMKMEDEEQAGERGSSGDEGEADDSADDKEVDEVLNKEEALLISEAIEVDGPIELEDSEEDDDDDDDDDDELDEDKTPRSSFQARLERLRANALRTRTDADSDAEDSDEDDEDDWFLRYLTKAEQDNVYLDDIEDLLDENQAMLYGTDRRKIKQVFNSISNGDYDDFDDFSTPARRRKDKGKGLQPDLHAQWEKDRARKAEFKKQRDLAKLVSAADPLVRKKGGKKARRAIQRAASLDPTIHVLPNRVIDMSSLVQQIRRFIADVGGPPTMSLPPTNKHTRKNIHEMALAFNLKSVSKGQGDARYTTLTKTTRSGFGPDERKIAKIMRRSGGPGALGNEFIYEGKGRGGPMPKHREGDEVGGAAPKLTESNVGFRLLEMMGWAEGDRIGSSMKGLEAPLTAIIKTSKRGLGAT
ncbi:hypothetical protein CPB83DRAFT_908087 [Crepidotus variabilis]|uniref:Protein SQS1 n=1 Tax=Crepidotus variabilis TaxID=179855 RepID=A0A9P6ED59_9AGAR|nr:hypothetical protein CPB83DRAFT_908087 [Crepidotus variabilis]